MSYNVNLLSLKGNMVCLFILIAAGICQSLKVFDI